MRAIRLKPPNNKKKIVNWEAIKFNIQRGGLSINPLSGYNPTASNPVSVKAMSSSTNLAKTTIDGWSAIFSSISLSNGVLSCTANGGNLAGRAANKTEIPVLLNKKVYIKGKFRVTNSSCLSINIRLVNQQGSDVGTGVAVVSNPVGNILYDCSCIITVSNIQDGSVFNAYFTHNYVDASMANGKVMEISEVEVIDLSTTFGLGNEPSSAWCDANIPFFNGTLQLPSLNPLVKHGDYAYVGGDTTELTFDFGTKVANSVAECPLKMYYSKATAIKTPSDITGDDTTGFVEITTQSYIDPTKTQDGTLQTFSTLASGGIEQLMIELDLSSVVNNLCGGSNSAFESLMKMLNFEVWSKGSGANGGVLTNGCTLRTWYDSGGYWSAFTEGTDPLENNTSSSAKIGIKLTSIGQTTTRNNSSNKVYLLVNSKYASDGTTPSLLSLDYLKITLQLTRTADTVIPQKVNLPKYWAVYLPFAPDYTPNNWMGSAKRVFEMRQSSTELLAWVSDNTSSWYIAKMKNGSWVDALSIPAQSPIKVQGFRFLFGKSAQGYFIHYLKNNGTVGKVSDVDQYEYKGLHEMRPSSTASTSIYNGQHFHGDIKLIDLSAIGRPKGFTDLEAVSILRGGRTKNLFNSGSNIVQGYYLDGSGLPGYDGVACYQQDYIPIKPSTAYTISCSTAIVLRILWYDSNKTFISRNYTSAGTTLTATSPANAVYARVSVNYQYVTIVQLEEGSTNTTFEPFVGGSILGLEEKELFDINKVTLGANTTLSNGVITITADTTSRRISYMEIPVLPNNRYNLKAVLANISGSSARINIDEYNGCYITRANSVNMFNVTEVNSDFITLGITNKIRINMFNFDAIGVFTFSNISLKLKM